MKAILTKYHGPTDTRGARISAEADGWGRVYVSYPYELSGDEARWKAAVALLDKAFEYHGYRWHQMVAGGLPNGDVVFCFAEVGTFFWHPKGASAPARVTV